MITWRLAASKEIWIDLCKSTRLLLVDIVMDFPSPSCIKPSVYALAPEFSNSNQY